MKRHFLHTPADFPRKRQLSPSPTSATQLGALPINENHAPRSSQTVSPVVNSTRSDSKDLNGESRLRRPYRSRACDACRYLKVRCEPHPNPAIKNCHKCENLGRECVITPASRKRKKRTDTRVAELEAKIDTLVNSLRTSGGQAQGGRLASEQHTNSHNWNSVLDAGDENHIFARPSTSLPASKNCCCGRSGHEHVPHRDNVQSRRSLPADQHITAYNTDRGSFANPVSSDSLPDAIDRGILDFESARSAFRRYVFELSPMLPVVIFPPGTDISGIRVKKPILFWAIVAVSIGTIKPNVQSVLMQETYKAFGERIFMRGQKSLEIVQALLVCSLWYRPPEKIEELKIYQLVCSAVAMAIDLGMNKSVSKFKKRFSSEQEEIRRPQVSISSDEMEIRRTWLGLYSLSVQISIALKRVFLVRWNQYMDESMEIMEGSSVAVPSDASILHWTRLAHIMEQFGTYLALDDGSAGLKLEYYKVQYTLRAYEKLLGQWGEGIPKAACSPTQKTLMEQALQVMKVHMHEVALHLELDDHISQSAGVPRNIEVRSAERFNSLITCVTSVHSALNIAFSLNPEDVLKIPSPFMSRIGYCAMVLIKLAVIASSPETHVKAIYDAADLKAEYYVDKCEELLRTVGQLEGGRSFARIAKILNVLKKWFLKSESKTIPFEEAMAILSFPRHMTSAISELFQKTAHEQSEQETQSTSRAQPERYMSDASPVRRSVSHTNLPPEQGQNIQNVSAVYPSISDNTTCPSDNNFGPYDLASSSAELMGSQTNFDVNQLYTLGSLLDNGFLQVSSSFDDFMGFF